VRLRTCLLCLSLAGCATETPKTSGVPSAAVLVATIQRVFAEAKLPGTPEMSVIRPSLQPVPGDCIVCLKSSAPDQPLRYAIFFQNGQYLSSRIAILADLCGEQTYVPAPSTPEQEAPPPRNDLKPRPSKRG
jgi:hypothetical protein